MAKFRDELECNRCGLGYSREIAYLGDQHADAVDTVIREHNAALRAALATHPPEPSAEVNQPNRAALGAVDEAMVERALRSFWSKEIEMGLAAKVFCAESRNDMRAALEAALASRHLTAIDPDAQSDATQ